MDGVDVLITDQAELCLVAFFGMAKMLVFLPFCRNEGKLFQNEQACRVRAILGPSVFPHV